MAEEGVDPCGNDADGVPASVLNATGGPGGPLFREDAAEAPGCASARGSTRMHQPSRTTSALQRGDTKATRLADG